MKKIFVLVVSFLIYQFHSFSQDSQNNQSALTQAVITQANQMAASYKSGDYKGYVKFILPVYVNAAGGQAKMIASFNALDAQLKSKDMSINSIVYTDPSEILKVKNESQCVIEQQTELQSAKGRVTTYTTLIAISTDDGKTWKFMDTSNMDIAMVRRLLPNLSSKIVLPAKQKPTVHPI